MQQHFYQLLSGDYENEQCYYLINSTYHTPEEFEELINECIRKLIDDKTSSVYLNSDWEKAIEEVKKMLCSKHGFSEIIWDVKFGHNSFEKIKNFITKK